ncbi:hypothetical protein [Phaeodactylibacter xiamenensis]|uniref:hypothetical protein n=1 Tax=Phaeodactylibacter xiamenensis TaxID=1524460 RepID=UPI0024A84CC5|nr:hypothetical protein [Phaeodactylibacter xiamenensis]
MPGARAFLLKQKHLLFAKALLSQHLSGQATGYDFCLRYRVRQEQSSLMAGRIRESHSGKRGPGDGV